MRRVLRAAAVLGIAAGALMTGTTVASASGGDFGDHVVTCEQTMGFDGAHNPGTHEGYEGWTPDHVCDA